jgi:hypothetical protein
MSLRKLRTPSLQKSLQAINLEDVVDELPEVTSSIKDKIQSMRRTKSMLQPLADEMVDQDIMNDVAKKAVGMAQAMKNAMLPESMRSSKTLQSIQEDLMEASQGSGDAMKKLKNTLTKVVEYLTSDNKGLLILFGVLALGLNIWYWILHGFSIQKALTVKAAVLQSGAAPDEAEKKVEELKISYPFTAWFGGIATLLFAIGIIFVILYYVNSVRGKLWMTLALLMMILSVILSLLALGKYYFY